MKIKLTPIKVRDLIDGYVDNQDDGVHGYGGRLDIRPAYQREFVYDDTRQKAVINTVMNQYPLNTMYWVKNGEDSYEVLDGQQRALSICHYAAGKGIGFGVDTPFGDDLTFSSLPDDLKRQILDYELQVYVCEGETSDKLAWFKTVNVAGMKLTDQELRNAVYTGPWLADAKRKFSARNGGAVRLGKGYVSGDPIRQELLEKAIRWACLQDDREHGARLGTKTIEAYMGSHRDDTNADDLWAAFERILKWVKTVYTCDPDKYMRSVDWGRLYVIHHTSSYMPAELNETRLRLLADDEVRNKKGIYEYLLTGRTPGDERLLNLRTFNEADKRVAYEKQQGLCAKCGQWFAYQDMDGDHIIKWHDGGQTIPENCRMLCHACNRSDNQ